MHFVKYIGKNLSMNLYYFLLETNWSYIFTQTLHIIQRNRRLFIFLKLGNFGRSLQGSVLMIDEQLLILRPTTPSLALLFTS